MENLTLEIQQMKLIRKKIGWSQQKLSNKLGVSISSVNRWENGKGKPENLALKEVKKFIIKYNG